MPLPDKPAVAWCAPSPKTLGRVRRGTAARPGVKPFRSRGQFPRRPGQGPESGFLAEDSPRLSTHARREPQAGPGPRRRPPTAQGRRPTSRAAWPSSTYACAGAVGMRSTGRPKNSSSRCPEGDSHAERGLRPQGPRSGSSSPPHAPAPLQNDRPPQPVGVEVSSGLFVVLNILSPEIRCASGRYANQQRRYGPKAGKRKSSKI